MEGKDNIKELFSQKLGSYEAPVNPELWAKISSQVAAGATTAATTTGLSVLAKVGIGLGISAAAITTVVLLTASPDKETVPAESPKEVQKELPTSTTDEKEQVAELTVENESNSDAYRDVREYLNTASSEVQTPETVALIDNPTTENESTRDTDFPRIEMETKSVETVSNNENTSEPTIVEGVTYGEMTNYGAAAANTPDPEQLEEATTPKVVPIQRYVNVFTPNGDGINDYFSLESEGLTDFSVVVFNPAGDIVFQSADPQFSWDGRDMRSGEMVDSGTYMYMVSSRDAEGNPFPIYERLVIKH